MEYPGTARLADRWPQQPSLLDREPLEPDYVRRIVRHGLNMMPPFRPSEISARELDALARYLSTSAAQKNKIEDKEK
jgi:mono/diheme cytochrome c family protein